MLRPLIATSALALAAIGSAQAVTLVQGVTVSSVSTSGTVNNLGTTLVDGVFATGSWWDAPTSVWWTGQTGATGAVLTLNFDQLYTLTDLTYALDHNDFYVVQVSTDNLRWNSLFVSLPDWLDSGFAGSVPSIMMKSSVSGMPGYSSLVDFAPVQARHARIYALSGDGSYAVTEMSFSGVAVPVPEPATYGLMALGLLAVGAAARRRAG